MAQLPRRCLRYPCAQKAIVGRGETLADRHYLLGGLAFTENHLGLPLTECTMVIDAGECEVFEGKVPQPSHGLVGRKAPSRDVGQQGLELLDSHATATTGSR